MANHPHLTDFSLFDMEQKKAISFRQVNVTQDLDMLFGWMHEPHVIPFWNLAVSYDAYKKHLQQFLNDPHQMLHIGSLNEVPMSYWETYWAKDDIIGETYHVHSSDQGIHLLLGPPDYIGKGYALPLLKTMIYRLFLYEKTEKIIAEPDIRNEKMIYIFKKCGFEVQTIVKLPDKHAALMFCYREPFLKRWKYV
ncbi:GNAT family N-acetyltransferase [Shimazuella kribbensis]|uniref:GNAT family N-acetyltransferase n=1 Tax=Shimazuella kribbensis TaxID=139808 RepID=UPI0004087D13|nr:GNAT family N-acetyltransferase [Shimazuella kribbensis]